MLIDKEYLKRVNIVRRSQTQDESGNYGSVNETIIHYDIIADIQPDIGGLKISDSGINFISTHKLYTEETFTDIQLHDVVIDGSDEYEITFIAYGDEYSLKKL